MEKKDRMVDRDWEIKRGIKKARERERKRESEREREREREREKKKDMKGRNGDDLR